MRITVAICTWNRCELLRETLAQMTRLVAPRNAQWELLVVDNNCTDDTSSVLDAFVGRLPIRVVRETQPGLSHSRNRALRESSADYVVFTDDDVLVDERWLVEVANAAHAFPDAAAFGGPITPWFLAPPDPDLCTAFPSLESGFCGLGQTLPAGPMPADAPIYGANMAFSCRAVAGMTFNPALGPSPSTPAGGDEVAFLRELRARGGVIVWWPAMHVKHCVAPERTTLSYLQKFTFGKGREYVFVCEAEDAPSPQLFGVPRWLWRAWAVAASGHVASRCGMLVPIPTELRSGPTPSSDCSASVHRLVWLRERLFLAGMMEGLRERRRVTHAATVSTGAGASARA